MDHDRLRQNRIILIVPVRGIQAKMRLPVPEPAVVIIGPFLGLRLPFMLRRSEHIQNKLSARLQRLIYVVK
ncbi:hypothetical protein D3C72_2510610 [compost metagenome]